MRCGQCGMAAVDIEELKVENLDLTSTGRIDGRVAVTISCSTCGIYRTSLDVEVNVQVPQEHRAADHDLEITFEAAPSNSQISGFPAIVQCSCGALRAKGVVILRRPS
jgi:hypothetical protein